MNYLLQDLMLNYLLQGLSWTQNVNDVALFLTKYSNSLFSWDFIFMDFFIHKRNKNDCPTKISDLTVLW